MTPAPFDLPLDPSEAAQVAQLIFEQAERQPLTEDLRHRLAARAAVLRLRTITPYFGSLARDPVHPSTYYLAVDGENQTPLLLHLAAAAAPTSSIFHKPLLIGRMRLERGEEVVINAVPFGPCDEENLEKFAGKLDPACLPRPQGTRAALAVAPAHPATDLPAAFEAYRAVLKRTGLNLAAISVAPQGPPPPAVYLAGLWSAIRAGWREGYSIAIEIRVEDASLDAAKETVRQTAAFTGFALDVAALSAPAGAGAGERFGPGLAAAAQLHEHIRQLRSVRKLPKSFDFEVSLEALAADEQTFCLDWLKARGLPAQPRGSRLLGTTSEPGQIAVLSRTMSRTPS